MIKYIIATAMMLTTLAIQAQETPSEGLLLPRMTTAQRTAMLTTTAKGTQVYDTTTNSNWFYNGTTWVEVASTAIASKWTNDVANTRVALPNLSDGITARPAGNEMVITDAGYVGIGTSIPQGQLQLIKIINSASLSSSGNYLNFSNKISTTADATNYNIIFGQQNNVFHEGTGTVAEQRGFSTSVQNLSSGTVTLLKGLDIDVRNMLGGNVAAAYGSNLRIKTEKTGSIGDATGTDIAILKQGSGIITNGYGIKIGSIQATNKWSLYTTDSTAPSYFAGNIGIGITTPTSNLQVRNDFSGSTAGASADVLIVQATQGNQNYLKSTFRRHTAGTDWNGTNYRMQKVVDTTPQAFIDYGIDGISSSSGLGFGSGISTNMVVASNGNVGIGITSPTAKLHMQTGKLKITNDEQTLFNRSSIVLEDTGAGMADWSLDNLGTAAGEGGNKFSIVQLGVANRLVIEGVNGNVGIGTAAPQYKLEVIGNTRVSGNLGVGSTTPTARLEVADFLNSTLALTVTDNEQAATLSTLPVQALSMSISNNFSGAESEANFINRSNITSARGFSFIQQTGVGAFTELVRIKGTNGNMGVGVSAPIAKLEVNGYIKVGSADATVDAASATPGMIRYNSTSDKFQGYTTTGWVDLN